MKKSKYMITALFSTILLCSNIVFANSSKENNTCMYVTANSGLNIREAETTESGIQR